MNLETILLESKKVREYMGARIGYIIVTYEKEGKKHSTKWDDSVKMDYIKKYLRAISATNVRFHLI